MPPRKRQLPPPPQEIDRSEYVKYGDELPPNAVLLRDLRACQGDLDEFLHRHAGKRRREVLFEINVRRQEAPSLTEAQYAVGMTSFADEWDKLIRSGEQLTLDLVTSRLLTELKAMTDVGDVIKVVERLAPEKWARKTVAGRGVGRTSKGDRKDRLDELLGMTGGDTG